MIHNLYETHLEVKNLAASVEFYKKLGLHTWKTAAAVYFHDPDENELELIAWLPDEPQEPGTVPYLSEWNERFRNKPLTE
nr:hypothetical protein [Paenibacillus humicola]